MYVTGHSIIPVFRMVKPFLLFAIIMSCALRQISSITMSVTLYAGYPCIVCTSIPALGYLAVSVKMFSLIC